MRYLLFAGPKYYARGGMRDYKRSYWSLSAAKKEADKLFTDEHKDFSHVYDLWLGKIVHEPGRAHYEY